MARPLMRRPWDRVAAFEVEEAGMSEVSVLGIDLGKTSCSVAGMSANGQVVLRRRVARDGILPTSHASRTGYKEPINSTHLADAITIANKMHDAAHDATGADYKVQPGAKLYVTSGAADDYAFWRSLGAGKTPCFAFTYECGTTFLPLWSEFTGNIQDEIHAGMLALLNHDMMKRSLPAQANLGPDGKPLLSWRVHILPYMEQSELYSQFHLDEPWDSEHNRQLISQMPEIYRDPSSKLTTADGRTHYLGAAGDGRLFEKGANEGRDMTSIRDGTSNTIAVVQVDASARPRATSN